jgi:peroxisomal membrane protein 2
MKTVSRSLIVLAFLVGAHSFSPATRQNRLRQTSQQPSLRAVEFAEGISDAWNAYNGALEANPLLVKSVTAGVILGAADLTGQTFENSKSDGETTIDVGRVARFALFGLVLQAPWNHFYYLLLDGALPPTPEPFTTTTGIKVFIDQFVQAPIFTILIFFFLGLLEGKSVDDVKKQLDADYKDTMFANWKLWVPATAINIAFCPPALRVLFLNGVFFFWSIFLSLKLNGTPDDNVTDEL